MTRLVNEVKFSAAIKAEQLRGDLMGFYVRLSRVRVQAQAQAVRPVWAADADWNIRAGHQGGARFVDHEAVM